MEIMDPVDMSLEKFVIRHDVDRENVPLMRRVIMKSLTREFLLLSEGNPERRVFKFFTNMEKEINSLCVNGDYQRDEAVGLHMRKLWKLNKSHERHEMKDAGGRKHAGDLKPSVPRETTLRELFELRLESFLSRIKFDDPTLQEELVIRLWDKFSKDIRIFGKNTTHFEKSSEDLQQEIMEWFFSRIGDDIQDLCISEERGWHRAVSMYFQRLCRPKTSDYAAIGSRRKYLGAEKWKESVGFTECPVEPRLEVEEERGIKRSESGTILFGSARNRSEHASAVVKRAGWVNHHTVGLYLKDETPPLEIEEPAEIITLREDNGGNDNDNPVTSANMSCHKMDEDATDATMVESLEVDSINPSDGNASCVSTLSSCLTICGCNVKWATTVNGVKYYSCARPKSPLAFDVAEANEDLPGSDEETIKERNGRLLRQDRNFRVGRNKIKNTKRLGRSSNHAQELQTVEEIDISVERPSGKIDISEEEESTTGSCLREIDIEVGRKVNIKKVRHPRGKKIKVRGPSVRGVTPGYWRFVAREFSYIVQLYSCSAARYAMYRSNRRYKPGD